MRVDSVRTLALFVAAAGVSSSRLAAQSVAEASAELSADSVAMAEVFSLSVHVAVPAGSAVFFPDTLAASADLESFAPVEWRAERAADDGAVIVLTYPLIPFGTGNISVPGLEVVVGPADLAPEGERVPGGSSVGAWADAPRGTVASIHRARVPDRTIRVRAVQIPADSVGGVSPRGPDDVVGPSWSWPAVTLLALFSSTLIGTGVTGTREWLGRRTRHPATPVALPLSLDTARLAALAELDRLLAEGPHEGDRVTQVYQTGSGIVRGYGELLYPEGGPYLTSSELMGRLRAGAQVSDACVEAMATAEAVKFGRRYPTATATESDLRALRDWISRERGT